MSGIWHTVFRESKLYIDWVNNKEKLLVVAYYCETENNILEGLNNIKLSRSLLGIFKQFFRKNYVKIQRFQIEPFGYPNISLFYRVFCSVNIIVINKVLNDLKEYLMCRCAQLFV